MEQEVAVYFEEDRKERARKVGQAIMSKLERENNKKAWRRHQAVLWLDEEAARGTEEFVLWVQGLQSEHILANRYHTPLLDEAPTDSEIWIRIKTLRLWNGWIGDGTVMQAEHIKGTAVKTTEEKVPNKGRMG